MSREMTEKHIIELIKKYCQGGENNDDAITYPAAFSLPGTYTTSHERFNDEQTLLNEGLYLGIDINFLNKFNYGYSTDKDGLIERGFYNKDNQKIIFKYRPVGGIDIYQLPFYTNSTKRSLPFYWSYNLIYPYEPFIQPLPNGGNNYKAVLQTYASNIGEEYVKIKRDNENVWSDYYMGISGIPNIIKTDIIKTYTDLNMPVTFKPPDEVFGLKFKTEIYVGDTNGKCYRPCENILLPERAKLNEVNFIRLDCILLDGKIHKYMRISINNNEDFYNKYVDNFEGEYAECLKNFKAKYTMIEFK